MGAAVNWTNGRHIPRRRMVGVVVLLAFGLLTSCIGSSGGSAAPKGSVVNVTLHDFRMTPASSVATAGPVTFRIHNDAPMTHEFVVVHTNLSPTHLPIATDGLSIDEDQLHSMGENSDVQSGTVDTLNLKLPAGHYVYFCNLEGHYLGGMHGSLTVTNHA